MNEQFKYVLSDQIEVIDQFNPRKEDNYDVENLYESIKQQNILTPILVMESSKTLEDGRPVYKLFEGHRRFKTLSIIENEENVKRDIPVRIFEKMTEDEMLVATAFENKDIFDKVIKDENAEEGRKSTVEAKVAELKNTNEFDQLKNSVVTSSQAK